MVPSDVSCAERYVFALDVAQAIQEVFDLCVKIAGFFGQLGRPGLNV